VSEDLICFSPKCPDRIFAFLIYGGKK